MKLLTVLMAVGVCFFSCKNNSPDTTSTTDLTEPTFQIKVSDQTIQVFQVDGETALVTQNAKQDMRPYLHPIVAPYSKAQLTEYSPGHHKHQTGLYWGFTRMNGTGADEATLKEWFYKKDKPAEVKAKIGRDYFHNNGNSHWQKVSADVLVEEGKTVKWKTIYNLLDENQQAILEETQTWTFAQKGDKYLLNLEWDGKALTDITINKFDYGGLFLRMPWRKGIDGEAINAARQRNGKAEGQRAMWVDVGMEMEGLEDWGHIAIFDHPENGGFPQNWRVDGQLGIGPVPARTEDLVIKKGEIKSFLHQVVAYSGELNSIEMNELWSDYIGDHNQYNVKSLWKLAQEEGRNARFLNPKQAVKEMSIQNGYKVNAYAAEPMLTQPMAFCWDDKGRMWIAENRDYESRGKGFSNGGDSKILILEDEDKDGIVDTRKVFLEGIPFPAAIAVGHGGVFIGAPPNLLFVPDKNEDDVGEMEDVQVLLTGWGIRDRHETINSFHWGPDGWLYGLEGFATPSKIRKPIGKGKLYKHREAFPEDLLDAEGVDINGGVWRYHPIKDRFEVVAHGFSNPWGIDYDAKGQLFITACVIPHLFHVIPGGIYHRQGGSHFNPYAYEDIRTIVDHRHRSAHGGARIYQSDAFPPEQKGRLFMANIHEHAVLSDILKPNGSGYTASHGEDFMMANNAQWIGFSMEIGPEGGLYVLDWHDADICGNDVVNKETGRVYRIMPKKSHAEDWAGRYADLGKMSDAALVNLQRSESNWHAQRARVILQYRAHQKGISEQAVSRLNELLADDNNEDLRLRALWTLHITNQISSEKLAQLLSDKDPYIRGWAIQFLCEDGQPDPTVIAALNQLSQKENSPVVRLYLAGALQKLDTDNRWEIASALAQVAADANDPNIPHMLWFGLEPLVVSQPDKALAIAKNAGIPSIARKIARRLVDGDLLENLVAALEENSINRRHLLEGMSNGMAGRNDLKEPTNWASVYQTLQENATLVQKADEIAQQFGNSEAAKKLFATLENPTANLTQKQNAIKGLAAQQRVELKELLPDLMLDKEVQIEAIRAIAAYDDSKLGKLLFENYHQFDVAAKQEAIQTFAARPVYGGILAWALKEGQISKKDIPAYVALQLRRVVGNGFVEIWGPMDDVSSDVATQFNKYQRLLTDDAIAHGDLKNGLEVYQRTCNACHKMHGEGGVIGPDLTGSNRTNTAYLLSNILDPSGDIQDDYKMVVITSQDGRTYSGNIIAENDRSLTLRVVGQDPVSINKSDIQSKEVTTNSLMPQGLLNPLTDDEVINLVAYLKTLEPPAFSEESD
ncbi:MAG: PVC-type heme-binding CxxCH protein [Bacteroidota bacterium]